MFTEPVLLLQQDVVKLVGLNFSEIEDGWKHEHFIIQIKYYEALTCKGFHLQKFYLKTHSVWQQVVLINFIFEYSRN